MIWNSNLAYTVGLITTDGNLSKDGRHISLTSSDLQLLDTFKSCLKKNNQISPNPPSNLSKKPCFRVQLSDVVFYKKLLSIGLTPNKSLCLGELDIPDKYFQDFLRGHLDGDGSIICYKDKYNAYLNPKYVYDRVFAYFLSASKKHIDWIRSTVFRLKNLKGSISIVKSKSEISKSNIYRLKYSTKEALIIFNWLYYQSNLPCLKRKYLKVKSFLTEV